MSSLNCISSYGSRRRGWSLLLPLPEIILDKLVDQGSNLIGQGEAAGGGRDVATSDHGATCNVNVIVPHIDPPGEEELLLLGIQIFSCYQKFKSNSRMHAAADDFSASGPFCLDVHKVLLLVYDVNVRRPKRLHLPHLSQLTADYSTPQRLWDLPIIIFLITVLIVQ